MSHKVNRSRQLFAANSVNNENPMKSIKNNLVLTNRKQGALKVLTNTVQTTKKSDGKGFKQLKVLPMQKFDTEVTGKSPLKNMNYDTNDEFGHVGCMLNEKDDLPTSMTCNIDLLSNFFDSKNDDKRDWFLEDFDDIVNNKIQKIYSDFGEPDVDDPLPLTPPMPVMDFSEYMF